MNIDSSIIVAIITGVSGVTTAIITGIFGIKIVKIKRNDKSNKKSGDKNNPPTTTKAQQKGKGNVQNIINGGGDINHNSNNTTTINKNNSIFLFGILALITLVFLGISIYFLFFYPNNDKILTEKYTVTMSVNYSGKIDFKGEDAEIINIDGVKWSSDNEEIAQVIDNEIKGITTGTATITGLVKKNK